MNDSPARITGRAVALGLLFAALAAILTLYFDNRHSLHVTAVQIPVLPYVLLLLTVLLVNPLCRLIRIVRPFSVAETLVIFSMGLVSAGISTFGLAQQLVPVIGSLFNRHWNNTQTEWNRTVEPFLNEAYFVAVPGIQDAARTYQSALARADAEQARFDAADRALQAEARRQALEARLRALAAETGREANRVAAATLRKELAAAETDARQALQEWRATAGDPTLDPAAAAARHRETLHALREAADRARDQLNERETRAFDKVALFRRGLPPSLRAFPGFVPVVGEDDAESYVARLKRLGVGRRALGELRAVMAALEQADPAAPPAATADAAAAGLDRAVALLEQGADATPFLARKALAEAAEQDVRERIAQAEAQLSALSAERRDAIGPEIQRISGRIEAIGKTLPALRKEARARALNRERVDRHLAVIAHIAAVTAGLRDCRQALPARPAGESREALKALRLQFPAIDATFTRYLLGDIPWSDWIGPLWRWSLLIFLSYLMLFAFNVLIFRQWAYNEKLIYPLAELPELLAGHQDGTPGWVPALFRSGLFWAGFAISGLTLGWNVLCMSGAVPGLTAINLDGIWRPYITNTPLQGLLPHAKSAIFFTMIGLTFLIPAKVSFSLWFFSVLYMVQLLVLVGLNYGVNENSFPVEWWYTFNFNTAQGGGALIVFASVVLWKCRRFLLCVFMPNATRGLAPDERAELRFSSALFLASLAGITLILWRGMGASLWHTLFSLFIILVITIGLVRAVTEGGILGFQAWVSPFHFIRTLFGMNTAATAPSLFAPLMVYYSALFLDIKAFIAPAMANSLKIRDDLRLSRVRFHSLMLGAILLAMLVSLVTAVILSYSKGADSMGHWFYTSFPKSLFDKLASMAKTPPLPAPAETGWVVFGGALMAALLFLRQTFFWLPHPIGLILLVSPIMKYYWFSIFLGWIAKTLVTRYGSKNAYLQARGLFIGLIAGELVMVVLAMALSLALDLPIHLDLNRN